MILMEVVLVRQMLRQAKIKTKELADLIMTAHPPILYVLNMDSASVKATSLVSLIVGGRETLAVETEVGLVRQMLLLWIIKTKELAHQMMTAHPQTQCVLNMGSVSVKATILVIQIVGGTWVLRMVMGVVLVIIKTKEFAHQMMIVQPQTQCVQNMGSASVRATSLEILNAGGKAMPRK